MINIKTKELTFIIFMAIIQMLLVLSIVQMAKVITNIRGSNYLFTIILAIPIAFSLLMYKGKRWNFFFQMSLFTLLIIPTNLGGTPFDPIARLGGFATGFLVDIFTNSIYKTFQEKNKLIYWAILTPTIYYILSPIFSTLVKQIFYSPELVEKFLSVVLVLLPIIIIEAAIGGYLGYKIFKRISTEFRFD